MRSNVWQAASLLFVRLALGTAFLSAVADRFGLWGAPGEPNVAWGSMDRFLAYAATLNWYVPRSGAVFLGWTATVLEIVLGILLIAGYRLALVAAAGGLLLLSFALAMTFATGIKTAFDASVFSASGAAFLLSLMSRSGRREPSGRGRSEH